MTKVIKNLAAVFALVMLVGALPAMALAQEPMPADQCFTREDIEEAYQRGVQDGRVMCDVRPPELMPQCATFDFFENALYVPCFISGRSNYWLFLRVISSDPTQFELTDYGVIGGRAQIDE